MTDGRLLMTGAFGLLGSDVSALTPEWGFRPVPVDLAELDVTEAGCVDALVRDLRPEVIIHCAA